MDNNKPPGREVKSVKRTFKIINELKSKNGATITEIENSIDMTKGSIHTHLATLVSLGYVQQIDDRYHLSYQFLVDGEYVRNHTEIFQSAWKKVNQLALETGEHVHLMAEHDGGEILLHGAQGENAVATDYRMQMRQEIEFLHCTASGKAILSIMSDEEIGKIIEEKGTPQMTQSTITDREELFDKIASIREQGFAINNEEEISGISAIGVPISGKADRVIAALAISAPTSRITHKELHEIYPAKLKATANEIKSNISMS